MKTISLLVLIVLFTGITGFQSDHRKEKRAKQQLEMAQLIQNGRFRFIARSANSNLGSFNNLSSNYDMVFDSMKVTASLPYFGRAYSVSYGAEGGVKFDLTAQNIEKSWNKKKKMFTIATELADSQDHYNINLTTGLDGYANLKITFLNRQWISYYGTIEKIESKLLN